MLDFESKFDIFELKSSNLNIGRLNLNAEYYSSEVSKINLFLDRLREDYELTINKRLDNIDYLLEQAVNDANLNAAQIKDILEIIKL